MPKRFSPALMAVALAAGPSLAQNRFAERTPAPRVPAVAPAWPADGLPPMARFARPSTSTRQFVGSVGGGTQTLTRTLSRATSPAEAAATGTFGYDFAGLRPGRVFLAPSADPSRGPTLARSYSTAPGFTFDPLALRPVRKAVIEAREAGGRE